MLVGVCDFPGDYAFPPYGYGGIERWLWAAAVGARRAGADVHLLGPQWRAELADEWLVHPVRLEELTPDQPEVGSLRDSGYDLLIVGHEYPSHPAWRAVWETLDCDVATFQHWPYFKHQADVFDGSRARLYCYSDEMRSRYAEHQPIAELAVHLGKAEPDVRARDGSDLLWIGRIDRQKAPHLAIKAAHELGHRITIAGPVFDGDYVREHQELFEQERVRMVGEVGGMTRQRLLTDARAVVYTCDRYYVEAGAAIFGEALRVGTPVAALAWRSGTCAHAALCERTGSLTEQDPVVDDTAAARALAATIEQATQLSAREVQESGLARFEPTEHFRALATPRC